MKKEKLILIASLILTSFNSFADEKLILPTTTFKPAQILPAPPKDDSIEAIAERAYVKSALNNATATELELAKKDADTKNVSYLSDTIPNFNLENLPKTKELFSIIALNERATTEVFKNYFNRKRPYQIDTDINPCAPSKEKDAFASDPSGHTVMAFSSAVIMANLLPEYAPEIMHRAEVYGRNRIVCGAHHPFDVRSGQVLGTLIGQELLNNKSLQKQINDSKLELQNSIPKK